jgi:hypothetical protein
MEKKHHGNYMPTEVQRRFIKVWRANGHTDRFWVDNLTENWDWIWIVPEGRDIIKYRVLKTGGTATVMPSWFPAQRVAT